MTTINYAALPGLKEKPHLPKQYRRTPDYIEQVVAEYFGVTTSSMRTKSRERYLNDPRQIAMYLLRKFTKLSLKEVASRMGGRHHTAALHGVRHVASLLEHDELIKAQVKYLESQIE